VSIHAAMSAGETRRTSIGSTAAPFRSAANMLDTAPLKAHGCSSVSRSSASIPSALV
jgi:hypothetical protein